jgi:hypothetical protein
VSVLGLASDDRNAFPVYRFLGKRYRITYVVSGQLPLSPARLAFLMDDLPLAARLLTYFRKKGYTAEYTDAERRRFKGSREGSLSGEAGRVAGRTSSGRVVYFGYGRSQIGPWKLGGLSLARFDFAPAATGAGLTYTFRVIATPDSAFANRVMGLGLFRKLVQRRIREVVQDIDASTRDLEAGGAAVLAQPGAFSAEDQKRLGELLALP